MAWKGVHLTRPARLSLAHSQLCVNQEDGETTMPLEDIAWVIIDDHRTTITVALLAACAGQGIAVITTDARHMPSAITLPFHTHHRTTAIARLQVDAGAPLKKRLWQKIVRAKILNQAAVLQRAAVGKIPPLKEMAARVRSGDPENVEAQAARAYWAALFEGFTRGDDADLRNKALNYAYAVLRGCIARALTASGFWAALGLHHNSVTNPFNLADDLIEPFRPLADLAVFSMMQARSSGDELTREDRHALAGLPMVSAGIGDETLAVLHASDAVAQSLARALEHRDATLLALPTVPRSQQPLPGLLS